MLNPTFCLPSTCSPVAESGWRKIHSHTDGSHIHSWSSTSSVSYQDMALLFIPFIHSPNLQENHSEPSHLCSNLPHLPPHLTLRSWPCFPSHKENGNIQNSTPTVSHQHLYPPVCVHAFLFSFFPISMPECPTLLAKGSTSICPLDPIPSSSYQGHQSRKSFSFIIFFLYQNFHTGSTRLFFHS